MSFGIEISTRDFYEVHYFLVDAVNKALSTTYRKFGQLCHGSNFLEDQAMKTLKRCIFIPRKKVPSDTLRAT